MNQDTIGLLTQFLSAMVHYSQDHARRLKALERVLQDQPDLYQN
jgi:hypothetical protein